ncbi:MAG: hypothetical protein PHE21_04180 [Candidatus Dojkabacteria bacterium]|nr:hypothetical protein [Candidatus Dojkabacteria bacterium]
MENKKGLALRIILYIIPYILFFVSVYFFTVQNMLLFFIISAIGFGIYLFLIIKNYKVISPLSSVTFIIMLFLILAVSISGEGGIQANVLNERNYMLGVAFVSFFNLFVGMVWYLKPQKWKKILAVIYLVIINILLISFSLIPIYFYSNFIYTRIFIILYFLFNVFMIIKGKVVFRIFGIIGIFLSIGCLVFSAMSLSTQVFTLVDQEREEVFEFANPKVVEMIDYYNDNQLSQDKFCKYCGTTLKTTLYSNSENFYDLREQYGKVTSVEDPVIYRAVGQFYVEYPVKFKNIKETQYMIFVIENIDTDSTIFGFAITSQLGTL